VLVKQAEAYNLYEVKPEENEEANEKDKKTISTEALMMDRVPAQEWEEIFNEVWRRYRDFFYVKNMNGYDWKVKAK